MIIVFLGIISISQAFSQGKNFTIQSQVPSWTINTNSKGATPPDKDISDGYFISLYENQNHVGLQEEYTRIIREIVSDAGVQNGSEITITYEPDYQKLIFHKVILWRNNQPKNLLQSHKFKVLQTEKDLSKFIYSGTYDAFLLLDDIRKGDRIEYAYTIKGNNPIFGKNYFKHFYFEGSSSIGHHYSNLIIDQNIPLYLKNFNFNTAVKTTDKAGLRTYEWDNKLTKTYREAPFEPSWYNPLKRTQITTYKNWTDVVDWALAINNYSDINTTLLDKKVKELQQKSNQNPQKYLELATRFVQDEIRYMGIEIGQYSHKPNSPEKVLKQRYGDCKDKSLLLLHLLSPMGIKSYMAYANTYMTTKTAEYLPSPFAFNHVVLLVELGAKKIWIDPTISYQRGPIDQLYFPDYGKALVLKKGTNALEQVKSNATGKLVTNLSFNLPDTTENNKTSLIVKTRYTGNYADNIRSEIADSGSEGLEKSYLEYYGKLYPNTELKAPLLIKDDEASNTIELTESYEIGDIWQIGDNGKYYIAFLADLIGDQLRDVPAKSRTQPLSLRFPVNIEQTLRISTPERWNMTTEPFELDNNYFHFESNGNQEGKLLTLNYIFKSKKEDIAGSEVKKYVTDKKTVEDQLNYFITRGSGDENPFGFNPLLVVLFIITLVISIIFVFNIYQKKYAFTLDEIKSAPATKGWLIVLAIYVVLIPIELLTRISTSTIWPQEVWDELSSKHNLLNYGSKILFIGDVILSALLFCFSILGIFLFFNRRKSFPKLYISFLIGYICLIILNYGIYLLLSQVKIQGSKEDLITNLSAITYCVLWIFYLKKSKRVRETFVFTYPEFEWMTAMTHDYQQQIRSSKKENIEHEDI
ncbi:DUF3857 domain-containing protein [Pedobacter gandavensis]|uniref:DUF3857 domain-containing protein n=1 Tax=Pedobacter gandavensis TaxID=2679963 RepID=UPI00292CAAF3|nr:DUF3857 domain-containing protein [Pedobacter gandavensis]